MRRIGRWAVLGAGTLLVLWLVVGVVLALTPAPTFSTPARTLPRGMILPAPPCQPAPGMRCVALRDGARLAVLETVGTHGDVVVLLHGVMGSARSLDSTAVLLRSATGVTVLRPDLRGHGRSDGAPGDVGHIGQYEEDVADLVAVLRREHPGGRIVLAGHSMGGGIAVRYAARGLLPAVDGYLLFAPHLGFTSPTSQPRSTPAGSGEAPMKLHLKRTIGLVMLNAVGVGALNGLPTLHFNLGEGFRMRGYTYRAMAGMAPDDHRAALRADTLPLLVVVGENDEAFDAAAYPAVVSLHPGGRAVVVPGAGHEGINTDPAALDAVRDWFGRLAPGSGRSDTRS
jgi:alpha-beta hydrolase superfamily lysophospholipase